MASYHVTWVVDSGAQVIWGLRWGVPQSASWAAEAPASVSWVVDDSVSSPWIASWRHTSSWEGVEQAEALAQWSASPLG